MLPNTLNTNEVKDSAGASISFETMDTEGRSHIFQKVGQAPNMQHLLSVKHAETGVGLKLRCRSLTRVDYTHLGADGVTPVTTSAYLVLDAPIGNVANNNGSAMVLANLTSFVAGNGTAALLKYDGTGTGAAVLLSRSV